ncbi:MAG: cell surface protein [Comamonas sp.]
MKKNVLALSIAAMIGGFAGAASAQTAPNAANLVQSEGGAGHILVVPYFTTQNNNMSVFHVVNTDTVNGKALKVRFRGAANSDDILDFTVFLSPTDVWTGSVQADANGSYFQTYDKSCTLPNISGGVKTSFVKDRLNPNWTADKQNANTMEGYLEVLNMADVVPGKPLFTATKHVNGVAPCTDSVLNQTLSLNGGDLNAAALALGLDTPSGGITGDWYILNVDQTTTFSGAATSIKAVDGAGANARGNYVLWPQLDAGVAATNFTADPLLKSGRIAAASYDLPDLSTPLIAGQTPEQQASALTAAVAHSGATNQYATDAIISAKTDWVLSMPTRRYSVGADYTQDSKPNTFLEWNVAGDAYRVFNSGVVDPVTTLPFFASTFTSVDTAGNICVNTAASTFYDREESARTSGAVISPGTQKSVRLCGEVSVLSFRDSGTSVLGATVARSNVEQGSYENGWGSVNFGRRLPVVGASFIKLMNSGGAANGFSGTYGITWPHRYAD